MLASPGSRHAVSRQSDWDDDQRLSVLTGQALQSAEPRFSGQLHLEPKSLCGDARLRQAALLTVCDTLPHDCSWLHALSRSQWTRLLRWLDFGGLALYFLDRIVELQVTDSLPAPVLESLWQRLTDNTVRMRSMTDESIAIQCEFQKAGLWYALLKGLSLWPSGVPKPELRSQFDLDFLVAEEDVPEAREILARRGYRLYDTNGRSWEFKRNEKPGIALKDVYKDTGSWRVELHADPAGSAGTSQLERLEWRKLNGFAMPVLSPVDLFLRQGLHAYKHIYSQFTRASFLVEFRRHVLFRAGDSAFWEKLHSAARNDRRACLALGVTTLLISKVAGEFAPEAFTSWTVRHLPQSARLWVELYGHRVVLGSFPGMKFYLFLQQEPQAEVARPHRPLWQFLVPLRLPPPVIRPFPNETMFVRLARYRMRAAHLLGRLPFCVVEGVRFVWERYRWRRLLNQVAR